MGRVGLELKVGVWSGPILCMLNHLFLFLGTWLSSGIGDVFGRSEDAEIHRWYERRNL